MIIKKMILKHKSKIEQKTIKENQSKNSIVEEMGESVEDKKIVVYTCITGNYDNVAMPLYRNNNVDYIMYTNQQDVKNVGLWEKRDIPENIKKLNDNVLINRYIKMHPHELFKDYDYSIYIDGNIRTVSDISSFVNKVNEVTGLALHRHSARNCIYEEVKACKLHKKGNIANLEKQIQKYNDEKMPHNYGLLEASVIVTDLNNTNSLKIENTWWDEFVDSKSYRDQISLIYVLWKLGFKVDDVGNLGSNVRANNKIEVLYHK